MIRLKQTFSVSASSVICHHIYSHCLFVCMFVCLFVCLQESHAVRDEKLETSNLDQSLNNCSEFKTHYGYLTKPLFQEEVDFPLAFRFVI